MPRPFYISEQTWKTMSWKEQDFVLFLRERKYSREKIMRKLYITTGVGYWKLQKRVTQKIKNDTTNGVNAKGKNALQ